MARSRLIGDSIDGTTAELGTDRGSLPELRTPQIAVILYHKNGSKVVPLGQDEPVVVGRSYPADAVVRDRGLSRQHARFTWDGARVIVEDLGSTNGTRVNGTLITRATINENDEVVLGSVTGVLHVLTQLEQQGHSLDGYEMFLSRLEEEVTRARSSATPISVLNLRPRAWCFHRCRSASYGNLRASSERHGLPRRDRRAATGGAGSVAPGSRDKAAPQGWWRRRDLS